MTFADGRGKRPAGARALAAAHLERFAAIAPIGGGGDPDRADRLRAVPIRAFHGADDRVVPPEESRRMVALIFPAVQSARETARRTQCENNRKPIGLASNSDVILGDAYPIGYIAWPRPPGSAAPRWAWTAAILPQLEQGPFFNAMNVKLPIDVPANGTVRTSTLAIYVCPSDCKTGAFSVESQVVGGPAEARPISYAANGGTQDTSQPNGMFRMNKSVRPKDIKDGLSNTFAAGERGSFLVQNAWAGALGDGRGGAEVLAYVSGGLNPAGASPSGFAGPHTGSCQFLMADGSVHSIKTTINPTVYRALATRNGREVIDQGAY
jgi:prepilin-type processing-associated H-X9-DG protein